MKKKRIKSRNIKIKTSPHFKSSFDTKTYNKLNTFLAILIAGFAFILYAQSLNHNYTLDDHKVVDQNTVTTKGLEGIPTILKSDYWYGSGRDELRGPIYRPTSLIIYATIWEFFSNNPQVYHFVNIFLYAISCLILFLVLSKLFTNQNLLLPLICTVLFAAHPIHTEVVNNIKSLDEILCFLFGIVSIWFFISHFNNKNKWSFILGGLSFFLSLISKETGISFLILIPLTFFFFTEDSKKKITSLSILLLAITGLWLFIRMLVLDDLPENIITKTSALNNTLYAAPDFLSRYATAFYILIRYIGLLILPHPLTSDYNFAQIKIQTFIDPVALIGMIFYLGLGIYVVTKFKKKGIIVFGILFYLISLAPVSNIFFLGGSSMAERFMYIPSLGFCLILSYLLIKLTKTENIKFQYDNLFKMFSTNIGLLTILIVILSLYSFKIFDRNKDWKDTLTVFSQDINVSGNSATANQLLGNSLVLRAAKSSNRRNQLDTFDLAKKYLKRALQIAPGFFYASSNLGYIYLVENKPDSAYAYLNAGLKNGPNNVQLNYYFGSSLFLLKRFDDAIKVFSHTISLDPKYEDAYLMLGASYLSKGDGSNGLLSYLKLIEINPNNGKAYYLAAGVLSTHGNTNKAKEFLDKAASLGYNPK